MAMDADMTVQRFLNHHFRMLGNSQKTPDLIEESTQKAIPTIIDEPYRIMEWARNQKNPKESLSQLNALAHQLNIWCNHYNRTDDFDKVDFVCSFEHAARSYS